MMTSAFVTAGVPSSAAAGGLEAPGTRVEVGERRTSVIVAPVREAWAPGSRVRFLGLVDPRRSDLRVTLVRRTPSGPRVVDLGRSRTDGSFQLRTRVPDVQRLRTYDYVVKVAARGRWKASRSLTSTISVAPTSTLAVDRTPVFFRVGSPAEATIDLPVELEAGAPVTIDASAVGPGTDAEVDVTLLDPQGDPVEPGAVGDQDYGLGVEPAVSGTYTVRLSPGPGTPTPVTGLLWASSPRVAPIEVDGDPVDLPGEVRPGQPTWLTFTREEADLFTVGCVALALDGCGTSPTLVSVGHRPSELGPVGPTSQDMFNPPRTGDYYLEDTGLLPHQVWLTSANPVPTRLAFLPEHLLFTRPGQALALTFDVEEGQQYAVSVIDRGLVDPRVTDPDEAVLQEFEVAGFGLPLGGSSEYDDHALGSSLTSFVPRADGTWTIYVDPHGPAVGPMEIDVDEVVDPAPRRQR